MKKILLTALILTAGAGAWAFYDFCESPQDYNTFPASYDFKTEYWTKIPNYDPDNIKIEKNENKKFNFPIIKKSPKSGETVINHEKQTEE